MTKGPDHGDSNPGELNLDEVVELFIGQHQAGMVSSAELFAQDYPQEKRALIQARCEAYLRGLEAFRPLKKALAPADGPSALGPYRIMDRIGSGGMATVYRAEDTRTGSPCAIKVLHPHLAHSLASVKRFEKEFLLGSELNHPNLVALADQGREGEYHYLVMNRVMRGSLGDELAELEKGAHTDPIDFMGAARVCRDVCAALEHSHENQIIHRDIKPHNILLDSGQTPHVVDFGLARILQDDLIGLTNEGDLLGTPGYMSPEQASGQIDVDESTDVYSLGVLMYELITGRLPFQGNVHSVIHQIIHEAPISPRQIVPRLPRDLETICLKALSNSPKDRFQSAEEFSFELRRYRNGEPILSRPIPIFEKIARWAKRKPTDAIMVGLLAISAFVLVAGSLAFAAATQRARDNEFRLRVAAEDSQKEAIRLRGKVELALQESVFQREIAQLRARESESSTGFLKSVFHNPEPFMWVLKGDGVDGGNPPTLRQLFSNAAKRLEFEFHGDDRTKANLMEILGDSCRSLGFFELSRTLLSSAGDCRQQIAAEDSVQPGANLSQLKADQLARIRNQFILARLNHDSGKLEEAISQYKKCIDRLNDVSNELREPADSLCGEIHFQLGRLRLTIQQNQQAMDHFERAAELLRKKPEANAFLITATELAIEFSQLGPNEVPSTGKLAEYFKQDSWAQRLVEQFTQMLVERAKEDWQKSGQTYEAVLETLGEKLPDDHPWKLMALGDYANIQWKAGHYEKAHRAIKSAIGHAQKIAPDHPRLIEARVHLGKELVRCGRDSEGTEQLEKALQSVRRLSSQSSGKSEINVDLWLELLHQYAQSSRHQDAEILCRELNQEIGQWTAMVTAWFRYLESVAFRETDPTRAQRCFDQSIEGAYSQIRRGHPENGIWCARLATIFLAAEKHRDAVDAARHAVRYDSERFFPEHPRVANRRILLGQALLALGKTDDAKIEFEKALKIRDTCFKLDDPLVRDLKKLTESILDLKTP